MPDNKLSGNAVFPPAHRITKTPQLVYVNSDTAIWQSNPPQAASGCTHPLLLLHSILATNESTFLPNTLSDYMQNGAYDCIIGFDYNWLQTPSEIAPQIATAVNQYFG